MAVEADQREITQEEVMSALVQAGEDPTATRVQDVHKHLLGQSLPTEGRLEAIRSAVDDARASVPKMLSVLSAAKRQVINDAIAAGYAAEFSETCVDLVRRSKHEKPRVLRGLRIWADGSAFDVTLDLGSAKAMRKAEDFRAILGLSERLEGKGPTGVKTKLITEKGRISLVIDDPSKARDERDVVAAMTLHEGTGCWQLVDIRLSEHKKPSPFGGSMYADDFCARFLPDTPEDATVAKSLLREYKELEDGKLLWCTFDGIVRGEPEINGYAPVRYFDQAGYFSKAGGLAKLAEIKSFWDSYQGDPATAKIPNPLRQPSELVVRFEVTMAKRERATLDVPVRKESQGAAATATSGEDSLEM
ncbi:hypothetical protein [Ralstonia sp. ASV6]|uniref:hypothetical protein n=1 Tax=Ralstonia sp. ASV6 TaxID=2795124 RepID=UPI0018ECB26B|nr:hypothetical protein [Ralstonia sp. ASV6]